MRCGIDRRHAANTGNSRACPIKRSESVERLPGVTLIGLYAPVIKQSQNFCSDLPGSGTMQSMVTAQILTGFLYL